MFVSSKIPVYYHIPKCGGTYILYLYQYLNKENEKKYCKQNWNNYVCRKINVYLNPFRYLEMTAVIELDYLSKINSNLESYSDTFSIEQLYKLIDENKIKITSMFIQPTGDGNMLDSKNQVDKLLSHMNKQPEYFTITRDVFERLYSEYSYLTNSISDHEPTKEIYKNYISFEDFLINSNTYNNQITRHIAYNLELNEKSFSSIRLFFDNFTIGTMNNIHKTATSIWKICYGWAADCTDQSFYKNENKNKLKIKVSPQAEEQFKIKTEWDRKLYDYLKIIPLSKSSIVGH
jgi:hypothetical protein